MIGELRAFGLAHGLLLGLGFAALIVAPALLPWAMQALFIASAFQLRIADRRWGLRSGWIGWFSHIRMAPLRLLPWVVAAILALIAARPEQTGAILLAAILSELVLYPIGSHLLRRLSRPVVAGLLVLAILAGAGAANDLMRYALAFMAGLIACIFWLRGPDGDVHALGRAMAALLAAIGGGWAVPATVPFAFPAAVIAATLTLAHLSVMRRRPMPWRIGETQPGVRLRWSTFRFPSA